MDIENNNGNQQQQVQAQAPPSSSNKKTVSQKHPPSKEQTKFSSNFNNNDTTLQHSFTSIGSGGPTPLNSSQISGLSTPKKGPGSALLPDTLIDGSSSKSSFDEMLKALDGGTGEDSSVSDRRMAMTLENTRKTTAEPVSGPSGGNEVFLKKRRVQERDNDGEPQQPLPQIRVIDNRSIVRQLPPSQYDLTYNTRNNNNNNNNHHLNNHHPNNNNNNKKPFPESLKLPEYLNAPEVWAGYIYDLLRDGVSNYHFFVSVTASICNLLLCGQGGGGQPNQPRQFDQLVGKVKGLNNPDTWALFNYIQTDESNRPDTFRITTIPNPRFPKAGGSMALLRMNQALEDLACVLVRDCEESLKQVDFEYQFGTIIPLLLEGGGGGQQQATHLLDSSGVNGSRQSVVHPPFVPTTTTTTTTKKKKKDEEILLLQDWERSFSDRNGRVVNKKRPDAGGFINQQRDSLASLLSQSPADLSAASSDIFSTKSSTLSTTFNKTNWNALVESVMKTTGLELQLGTGMLLTKDPLLIRALRENALRGFVEDSRPIFNVDMNQPGFITQQWVISLKTTAGSNGGGGGNDENQHDAVQNNNKISEKDEDELFDYYYKQYMEEEEEEKVPDHGRRQQQPLSATVDFWIGQADEEKCRKGSRLSSVELDANRTTSARFELAHDLCNSKEGFAELFAAFTLSKNHLVVNPCVDFPKLTPDSLFTISGKCKSWVGPRVRLITLLLAHRLVAIGRGMVWRTAISLKQSKNPEDLKILFDFCKGTGNQGLLNKIQSHSRYKS